MRFLIDENVRIEVVEFLQSAGCDVTRSASGLDDEKVAALAKKERRILLTHDMHFADILLFPPKDFFGIVRIKIHPPSANVIIPALKHLLSKVKDFEKKLIVLEKDAFRIRE